MVATARGPDSSRTPCPKCEQGIGMLKAVQSQGALKILRYACPTCDHRWQASERWIDDWFAATDAEPEMIRDDPEQ